MTIQEIDEAAAKLRTRLDESMIAGIDEITARAAILQVDATVQAIRILMTIDEAIQRVETALAMRTD